jgi:hypothetical protein
MGAGGSIPGGKVDLSPPSSAEVKIGGTRPPLPIHLQDLVLKYLCTWTSLLWGIQNSQYQNRNTGSLVVTVATNMSEKHAASIFAVGVTLRARAVFSPNHLYPPTKLLSATLKEMDMPLQWHLCLR